ncbi:MAG: hypothetical protein KAI55_00805 [Candidatus Aenigmarchaeota archaeon]|nr:hypothetical protein [Candidatus Aenigmarchaeota archaeon]
MTNKIKQTKERSVLYPYYNLKESIEFAKIVHKLAGKGIVADNVVAKELGVKSNANSLTYKISSAKQFGLIIRSKEGLGVTQRIKSIIFPLPGQELINLYRDVVKLPPLYAKIFQQYSDEFLPEKEGLSNVMVHQGVAQNAKNRAAKIFLSSINFAKYLDANRILNHQNEEPTKDEQLDESFEDEKCNNEIKTPEQNDIFNTNNIDRNKYQKLDLALTNDRNAIIIVPKDIDKKDVERLTKLLELTVIE